MTLAVGPGLHLKSRREGDSGQAAGGAFGIVSTTKLFVFVVRKVEPQEISPNERRSSDCHTYQGLKLARGKPYSGGSGLSKKILITDPRKKPPQNSVQCT